MKIIKPLLSIVAIGVSLNVNAALIDRGNGMIYDTDLDITWLQDANYAQTSGYDVDGLMSWGQAMTWAGQLEYGGYSDWRLPTTLGFDTSCSIQGFTGTYGYNCSGGEMGHLFYSEFAMSADESVDDPLSTAGDIFTNLVADYYWSSTLNSSQLLQQQAGAFGFWSGWQQFLPTTNQFYALAVRDGDVAQAVVPVPAGIWLFASGLLVLMGVIRSNIQLR